MDALIAPEGSLEILSRVEASQLRDAGGGGLYELWRQCSLAVLNSGASDDDVRKILSRHEELPHRRRAIRGRHRARAQERARHRVRRHGDDPRHPRAPVRRAARSALRARRRAEQPALRSRELRRNHGRRIPHSAQRARAARPRGAAARRLLGRPRDRARGVRLHEGRRLRARARGPRHLHGLRRRCHERPDERRDGRARQAAHPDGALPRAHGADDHRGRVAEPDLQRARHPARHGEAARGVRADGARDHRVPGRRRYGRGDPLFARHPAEPGERRRDAAA